MNSKATLMNYLVLATLVLVSGAAADRRPIASGGGPLVKSKEPCVHADDRAFGLHIPKKAHLPTGEGASLHMTGDGLEKLKFYPMGGRWYRDQFTNNFVDLDPGPGFIDFQCFDQAYNGHDATDTDLRTFGEQAIGVPIFAAFDGIVAQAVDGRPDMNTCPNSPCTPFANFVTISHGGGVLTQYFHMKLGSVAVTGGEEVKAGQQIGLVGSSGSSSWSHLHFAIYDNGVVVEPFSGTCNEVESGWIEQPPVPRAFYMRDFGVTYEDMSLYPGYPYAFPRSGQIALDDPLVYYWFLPQFLPANSTWRTQFRRPDGTIAFDSGASPFGNATNLRLSWWWHSWDIPDMHTITGTWHILFDINDERIIDAPVEVRVTRTPDFNSAPEPISAFLDPAEPTEHDVIFCNVDTDLLLDDHDYDIVRYHYVWEVDDAVVRDVITAAHSDAIPHHTAPVGAVVSCTVTPMDASDGGPQALATATIVDVQVDAPTVADDVCSAGSNDGGPCATDASCPGGVCGLKSRYVSINPSAAALRSTAQQNHRQDAGTTSASVVAGGSPLSIQVTIADIDDALGQNGVEGQVWWAGASQTIDNTPNGTLDGAQLLCEGSPSNAQVWPAGVIHLFGSPIVPGSTYEVRMCDATGGNCSDPLTVATGKWGDIVADFGGANQPNFGDITAVVDKFKSLASAPDMTRTDLLSSGGQAVDAQANFADISADVDAFKGSIYPHSIAVCP